MDDEERRGLDESYGSGSAELLRVLRSGAVCAISGKSPFYESAGFPEALETLTSKGLITEPSLRDEPVYGEDATPPEGHERDIAYLVTFRTS